MSRIVPSWPKILLSTPQVPLTFSDAVSVSYTNVSAKEPDAMKWKAAEEHLNALSRARHAGIII